MRCYPIPVLVAVLMCACASGPGNTRLEVSTRAEAQIRQRLSEILDAAEKKDFERLDSYHLYGPKFTKFETRGTTCEQAEAARKGEHESLGAAAGLVMKADDLRIDIFGGSAVATCVLKSSFDTPSGRIEREARSTFVFVKDRGSWKIVHEHLSRAG